MFCDLHGHSAKKSSFMYGCEVPKSPIQKNHSRIFPFMLSSENEHFQYGSCNFMIQKSKEGTARV